jgi:hypothetical protein
MHSSPGRFFRLMKSPIGTHTGEVEDYRVSSISRPSYLQAKVAFETNY